MTPRMRASAKFDRVVGQNDRSRLKPARGSNPVLFAAPVTSQVERQDAVARSWRTQGKTLRHPLPCEHASEDVKHSSCLVSEYW